MRAQYTLTLKLRLSFSKLTLKPWLMSMTFQHFLAHSCCQSVLRNYYIKCLECQLSAGVSVSDNTHTYITSKHKKNTSLNLLAPINILSPQLFTRAAAKSNNVNCAL